MNSVKLNIALAAPVLTYASTASTGGTLADSTTYFYRVSAIMAYGPQPTVVESLAVAQGAGQAVSSGTATNTVTITWTAVPGATGYYVYGRLTGAAVYLATVPAGTLTYTDTGAALGTKVVLSASTALAGNAFIGGANAGTLLFGGNTPAPVVKSPFTQGKNITVYNPTGGTITLTGSDDNVTFTALATVLTLSFVDIATLPNFVVASAAGAYALGGP